MALQCTDNDIEEEQSRLREILATKDAQGRRLRVLRAFREDYRCTLKDWPKVTRQEKS